MKIPPDNASVEMEVQFFDVDPMQIVWHGNYYKYVEIARNELMRNKGIDPWEIAKSGYLFVVIESKCRHTYPLRYRDRFRVTAWIKDLDYRLNIGFEITNLSENRRAARGHTILATLDAQGNLLLGTPDAILERLRP
jgi:acyl-CoA thioester hydrolase